MARNGFGGKSNNRWGGGGGNFRGRQSGGAPPQKPRFGNGGGFRPNNGFGRNTGKRTNFLKYRSINFHYFF